MSDLIASDNPFNAEECATLRDIVQAMIPASENRPSAADELIFTDIVQTARSAETVVRQVIKKVAAEGMDAVAGSQASNVRALVSIVVQCYYRDDRVMQSLDMEARPPHPQGYALPEDDWSLLDPVKARGVIYREV